MEARMRPLFFAFLDGPCKVLLVACQSSGNVETQEFTGQNPSDSNLYPPVSGAENGAEAL
jgi:hypothetical protein